jgi:hypothetical protein
MANFKINSTPLGGINLINTGDLLELMTSIPTDLAVVNALKKIGGGKGSVPEGGIFSVYGSVSANSGAWESSYSTMLSNSGEWDSVHLTVLANSGEWESSYSTVLDNSGEWESSYSTMLSNSGEWESVHSTVLSNSAVWGNGGFDPDYISGMVDGHALQLDSLRSLSGGWESSYSSVLANSAAWGGSSFDSAYMSGMIDSVYSTVLDNSAQWALSGGGGGSDVSGLSGNWQSAYTTVGSNSAAWDTVTSKLNTSDFNSYSGHVDNILSGKLDVSIYNETSGSWQSSYTTVLANSSNWSVHTPSQSGDINYLSGAVDGKLETSIYRNASGAWESTYSTVLNSSAGWDESSDVSYISGVVNQHTGQLSSMSTLSGNWDSAYSTVLNSSGSWNESTQVDYLSGVITGKLNISDFNSYSGSVNNTLTANAANIAALSGEFSYGDTIELVYSPSNYTNVDTTLSGHLAGIGDSLSGKLNTSIYQNVSGNWQSTYSTVGSNSSIWNIVTGKLNTSDFNSYSGSVNITLTGHTSQMAALSADIAALSGEYGFIDVAEIAYSPVNYTEAAADVSGHLNGIDTSLGTKLNTSIYQNASGTWQDTYSTVLANSAQWAISGGSSFDASYISGVIDGVYGTVDSNSATWNTVTGKLATSDFNIYSGAVNNTLTGHTSDISTLSAGLSTLSGDYIDGDSVDIIYSSTNYTAAAANISGHLNGIDSQFGVLSGSVVYNTGTQTIDGAKTFNETIGGLITNSLTLYPYGTNEYLATEAPSAAPYGIKTYFGTSLTGGWPYDYQGIVSIKPYFYGGGSMQVVIPYNSSDGKLKIRTGDYSSGEWTGWQDVITTNSSGDVGIGTNNPQVKLDVQDASNGVLVTQGVGIEISNTDPTSGNYAAIGFGDGNAPGNASAGISCQLTDRNNHYGDLVFGARNAGQEYAERMRMTKDGRFGIGTDVPDGILSLGNNLIGNGSVAMTLQLSGFNHGTTNKMPTDVFAIMENYDTNGALYIASTTKSVGIPPFYVDTFSVNALNDGVPAIQLFAALKNGAGTQKIASTKDVLHISNASATPLFKVLGNGQTYVQPTASNDLDLPGFCVSTVNGYGIYTYANTLNFDWGANLYNSFYLNYVGYQGGATQFRNLVFADGKQNSIMTLSADVRYVGIGVTPPAHLLHLNGGAYCDGSGDWIAGSDISYKKDIEDYDVNVLSGVMEMRPVTYVHKDDAKNRTQIGFIAQELEKIFPEVVDGEEGGKGIAYGRLTVILVKAIREQQKQIDELKEEINILKDRKL